MGAKRSTCKVVCFFFYLFLSDKEKGNRFPLSKGISGNPSPHAFMVSEIASLFAAHSYARR